MRTDSLLPPQLRALLCSTILLATNLAEFGFLEESLSYNKHSVEWGKYEGAGDQEE